MSKKILVVDNHPAMLKFMTGLLIKEGHQVRTAVNGLSALDTLETYFPDVIFIDLIMPNINGEKLCRIIRKKPEFRSVYVIILSAIAADEEVEFVEFGANACIAKGPFEQMGRHVLDALAHADAHGHEPPQGTTVGRETLRSREITRELLSVKHHFEVILESMTEGVMEITGDAKIVYANPTAAALIGLPEEELLASAFPHLFDGSDRDKIMSLLNARESALQCIVEDSPLMIKGKQVSLKLLPVKRGGTGTIVILEDVTERINMQAELLQAQKIKAIGTLAGGIAHDFNNALTGIVGNIALARLSAEQGQSISKNLDEAERACWKARDLTRQLLPFSKGGRPLKKPAFLPSVLKDICHEALRGYDVECECCLPEDLWRVEIDLNQVRDAVTNLLLNAVQMMPEGGTIRVLGENAPAESERPLQISQDKYVRVSIQDQGGGIPEEHLGRIFEPYFTTREARRGLGLASTHAIISQHGGCITVESELGVGTTFHIFLPAMENDASAAENLCKGPAARKGKVLVMDDQDMVREVAEGMLSHLGYLVAVAKDGSEAIDIYQKAQQTAEPFDAVITDLTVPGGMGGKETIRELLKIDPKVRAIVCSGYSNDPIMADYREHGFSGVIEKPYRMGELQSELNKIIDR
jgi:two-component system, cell cycle sensor histidine kinase and response regulator CckA